MGYFGVTPTVELTRPIGPVTQVRQVYSSEGYIVNDTPSSDVPIEQDVFWPPGMETRLLTGLRYSASAVKGVTALTRAVLKHCPSATWGGGEGFFVGDDSPMNANALVRLYQLRSQSQERSNGLVTNVPLSTQNARNLHLTATECVGHAYYLFDQSFPPPDDKSISDYIETDPQDPNYNALWPHGYTAFSATNTTQARVISDPHIVHPRQQSSFLAWSGTNAGNTYALSTYITLLDTTLHRPLLFTDYDQMGINASPMCSEWDSSKATPEPTVQYLYGWYLFLEWLVARDLEDLIPWIT